MVTYVGEERNNGGQKQTSPWGVRAHYEETFREIKQQEESLHMGGARS